ncbi:leucine-rich repeat domain-containing protein [Flavobacterium sp. HSC-61S13]|uniref:leucine-rich repeat domain-containing protein n=1 Tax=Flavobacterium sp. HSC-61S13 TaxID=2910963 RepID=UPI00209FFC12|nr:leucine-rich repeat domain-containing protein [Flavobacterium sp. HSC-61S13]MCP1994592.1 Leucine-rich repeat (LRR) protein [Flavobacterium sp. HSC-61S13]
MNKFMFLIVALLFFYDAQAQIEPTLAAKSFRLTMLDNQIVSFNDIDQLKNIDYNAVREAKLQAQPGSKEILNQEILSLFLNEMPKLQKLSISHNITVIPEIIHQNTSLKTLELAYNDLKTLPESLSNLKVLEELSLLQNPHFEQLPQSLSALKNLKYLSLLVTNFKEFPTVIFEIPSLETLLISGHFNRDGSNRILAIPDLFQQVSQLKTLNISNTELSELPSSIVSLTKLSELYLDGNKLLVFPYTVKKLPKLEVFGMSNNPLDFQAYKKSLKGISWRGLLYLADVGFTQSQYEELQALLPKHDLYY